MKWMANADEQGNRTMEVKEEEATDLEKCWSQYTSSLHTIENYYRYCKNKSFKESL